MSLENQKDLKKWRKIQEDTTIVNEKECRRGCSKSFQIDLIHKACNLAVDAAHRANIVSLVALVAAFAAIILYFL